VTLINARMARSHLTRWREALSMCRWILVTTWFRRSCAIAVLNRGGPMVVVNLRQLADLRELIQEMEHCAYDMEIRFKGRSE
jgi:hypothetical protein